MARLPVDRTVSSSKRASLAGVLLLTFILPFYFELGGIRLSAYRTFLIIFLGPVVVWWMTGVSGKIRSVDILVIAFTIWGSAALAVNHGLAARWEFIGSRIIETVGPYFLARTVIRDARAFRKVVRWYFVTIIFLLPFGLYQNFTERPLLLDLFGSFLNVYKPVFDIPRLGLYRAQASMPHPILFGVYCLPAFGLVWYVLGKKRSLGGSLTRSSLVGLTVFTSLSSGAYLGVVVQVALISWRYVFNFLKSKWRILGTALVSGYLFIEVFANSSPAQIFARYLVLNSRTAWNRINIFNNATDDIMRNPIFGIGFGYWTRPNWMVSSIDNFWLVTALRYGLPSLIIIVSALVLLFLQLGRKNLQEELVWVRLGYVFSLLGLCIAATTVHLWESTYCLLFFLMGSGVWMLDVDEDGKAVSGAVVGEPRKREIRYTRFQ